MKIKFRKFSVEEINVEIGKLSSMRQRVDQLTVSVQEEVGFYTQLNGRLLSIIDHTANNSSVLQLSNSANAIGSFLQHKERAGIERAVMSNTFATDKFTGALYIKFIALITEQNTYFSNFSMLVR